MFLKIGSTYTSNSGEPVTIIGPATGDREIVAGCALLQGNNGRLYSTDGRPLLEVTADTGSRVRTIRCLLSRASRRALVIPADDASEYARDPRDTPESCSVASKLLSDWAEECRVNFVSRSYDEVTTSTVSRCDLYRLIEMARTHMEDVMAELLPHVEGAKEGNTP